MQDKKLELKLLYRGHSQIELSLLAGALETEGIAYLLKRDVGLADMAPSVFFSPATDVKLYVAMSDWVKAEELACVVLGEEWHPGDPHDASNR